MTKLVWDEAENRKFETGVDYGILFVANGDDYDSGVAWNGLVTVTESPAGAEVNKEYADNIQYLSLLSAETFSGTIEAFTYPDAFIPCDGGYTDGNTPVTAQQQSRKAFCLAYRTKVGDALDTERGYKWHIIYNILASPSEKAYTTVNDTPAPLTFSWAFSTTPVTVPLDGIKPTSIAMIDSTLVDPTKLGLFEAWLLGVTDADPDVDEPPRLLTPADIIDLFAP